MATLTIRNLPDKVRERLRVRAAKRGVSMEAEVRGILSDAVSPRSDRRVAHTAISELQDWIVATRRSAQPDQLVSQSLIQVRRRDAITETVAEGLNPETVFGTNYDRILSEAGWTIADVDDLRRLHR